MNFATDRAGKALVRCLLLAVLLLFAALVLPHAGQAVALVDLATLGQQRDLGPVLGTVETDQRSLEVELPGTTPAARRTIMLTAKGPGPRFSWLVAAMSNSADGPPPAS